MNKTQPSAWEQEAVLIRRIIAAEGAMSRREIKQALGGRVGDEGRLALVLRALVEAGALEVLERPTHDDDETTERVRRTIVYRLAQENGG
jgi:hypothetical protein